MPLALDQPLDTTLASVLAAAGDEALVVGPTPRAFEALVDVAGDRETPPTLRVLAAEGALKDATESFLVAGRAADLAAADVLTMRTLDPPPGHGLVVTEARVVSLLRAGERYAALATEDAGFREAARSFYEGEWADAAAFTLRTPPLSRVRETLRAEVSEAVAADFEDAVAALGTARSEADAEPVDEVAVSLLVAAKHRELLYTVSKWGEDVGLASKATFSRTKSALEDLGVLDTEKVPIDVGRPRLRLTFAEGHERLRDASGAELASVARSVGG